MKIDYNLLGRRIARLRKERRLTQDKLSEKAEISNNYLSNIENGRSIPSLETLVRLCEAMEVTPDTVADGHRHRWETVYERRHPAAVSPVHTPRKAVCHRNSQGFFGGA